MGVTKITGNEPIPAGDIEFFDYIEPPLQAGSYTLSATQTLSNLPGENTDPSYTAKQPLRVDGPRFSLNPAQIHSLYPPANQTGQYETVLPNMVFSNFSLPWSRNITPGAEVNNIPWMGLLTVYPSEIKSEENTNAPVSLPMTIELKDLKSTTNKKLKLPDLGTTFQPDDTKVSVVDMSMDYFQAIAPTIKELPYLAHARGVNTDGKVMLGMEADGYFSLVVGNRLPLAVDGSTTKNQMFLVSYEGHQDSLSGPMTDYDSIRLVLLGSWQFTTSPARGSFKTLMEDLCEPGRGGVKLYQMPMSTESESNDTTKKALEIGYTALQNDMRVGENATSWYRGPLVPAPTKRDFSFGPYLFSDHAMHYDPANGIFNHSYAAAWQIGRLLALSDASFARSLFNWRNEYVAGLQSNAVNTEVMAKAKGLMGENNQDEEVNMLTALRSKIAEGFSKVDWPQVKLRNDITLGEQLPGVLTDQEKKSIIEEDADPLLALHQKIKGK